ncbi:hypothetical protein [Bifidobacterium longum]|uniref:Uncharacterized protein n=1 Tax=Bifidobacterium longum subsp. infantis TaxID=1682 RepID=A0A564S188_BIFLI|nr:hypothetical protein [Bifidobacterium longum]VUW84131.1 Uncharacterised protein [Bifidobacterium longum subsp. infantis]
MNIGKLTVTDGAAHTPAAPTNFQVERAYANSDELTVKWNLADYSTIKNYLLFLDNTFLGGRYDDTLYVKHLPAKTGTLKLYAVGADGSRSLATEAPLNEAAAVSDVKVEPGKDGNVKVSLDQSAGIRRENRDRQIRHRFAALRREAVFPDRQGRRRQEQSDDCQCAG